MSGRIMSDTSEFAQAVKAAASLRDVSTALNNIFQPPKILLLTMEPKKKIH